MKILKLNSTERKQLKSICNLLYLKPNVKIGVVGNYVVFSEPRPFFRMLWPRREKVHYLELCLNDIPKKLSKLKWKNLDLVATFQEGAMNALRNSGDSIINYLFNEILKMKIPEIFLDYETAFVPLPGSSVYLKRTPFNRMLSLNVEDAREEKTIRPLVVDKRRTRSGVDMELFTKVFQNVAQEAKIIVTSLLLYLGLYTAQLIF